MIHIAYLDFSYVFSGAEVSLHSLIYNLDKDKYEPIIIFPYPQDHQSRYNDLGVKMIYLSTGIKWWMGSEYWKTPIRGTDFLKRCILGLLLMIELRKKKINILHINLMRPDSFWWIWWSKIIGIKVIAHIRSDFWDWMPSPFLQKNCNAIICVSEYVKKMVSTNYQHPLIFSIHDPVDATDYQNLISKDDAKIKLGLNPKIRLISSVGLLSPHKGHEKAIEAFGNFYKYYDNLILLIAGGGNKNELCRLKNICIDKNLTNQIIFTEEQIPNIESVYHASEFIFSLTEHGEAFGRVPFEAASARTAFIGPDCGAIIEIMENHISGFLINPLDINAITEEAIFILNNPLEVNIIKENALNIVIKKLNPLVLTKQVCDVYDQILAYS